MLYKPRYYTVDKMQKVEAYFPIGEAVAGWYFYDEVDGAPIGPYPSRHDALVGACVQLAANQRLLAAHGDGI